MLNIEVVLFFEKVLVLCEDIRNEENVVDIVLVLYKSLLRVFIILDFVKNIVVKLGMEYVGKENLLGFLNLNLKRVVRVVEFKGGFFLWSKEDKFLDKYGRVGVMK